MYYITVIQPGVREGISGVRKIKKNYNIINLLFNSLILFSHLKLIVQYILFYVIYLI
jgi:hypothetical protein